MIFWLVLKFEISFLKIIFCCMMKYLDFHNSSFADFFKVNGKATQCDTPLVRHGRKLSFVCLFVCFDT